MSGSLLWRASLRFLWRHPWQMGLALLGVALGVAVVVAVELANQSAVRGFDLSHEALTGRATHQIEAGPGGLPESVYVALRVERDLRAIAPVVEGTATLAGRDVRVLGVDPFAEAAIRPLLAGMEAPVALDEWLLRPNGVLMLAEDAQRLGLAEGDHFELIAGGRLHELVLLGVLMPDRAVDREGLRDILVMDIAAAQELLGRVGQLDRIELVLDEGGLSAEAREALPSDARFTTSERRAAALDEMTAAFRLNLTAFSLLALVVGAFLIYNCMTFSVVQRRRLIGMLRALGVTRRQVFTLVLAEATLLGTLGTLLGLALGMALSAVLLELVTRTINDLYFVLTVRDVNVSLRSLLSAAALGVGASIVAAAVPAYEATRAAPRMALANITLEQGTRRIIPRLSTAAVALAGLGGAFLWVGESLPLAFGGLFALILSAALAVPLVTALLLPILSAVLGRVLGLIGRMAARAVGASLSRTGVAIAALMVAVSAVIGVGVMVDSFRHTFSLWLDASLRADVFVSAQGDQPGGLTTEAVMAATSVPGIGWHSSLNYTRVGWDNGSAELRVYDLPPAGRDAFQFRAGAATAWSAFESDDGLWITEPFAAHQGIGVGDRLRLATADGERDFVVGAIVYDYTTSEGAILMSRGTFERYWNDPTIDSLGLHAAPGVTPAELRRRLEAATAEIAQPLRLRAAGELREASLQVFDQTFTITQVLRLLAVLVAAVGTFSALLALALERAREFAVMRALGFMPRQILWLTSVQTGLVGLLAGLFAIPLGLVLAAILILVINQRSFGWSLLVHVEPAILWQALALAVGAALAAGVYPSWRLARAAPADALRED